MLLIALFDLICVLFCIYRVMQLQENCSNTQEAYFKIQAELMKLKGEKATAESELESIRRKLAAVESRAKQTENLMRDE